MKDVCRTIESVYETRKDTEDIIEHVQDIIKVTLGTMTKDGTWLACLYHPCCD